eukprot:TRINITY_DN2647_c0_g1_i2.p2 TRINITY_DN2647_c0_g1~~TRINITY_DN2647_c0_g1_i2.p2  ORF type:complete len:142 (+),score=2.48 TRINITY_DN2647_c0_g1_i2:93-518(+)
MLRKKKAKSQKLLPLYQILNAKKKLNLKNVFETKATYQIQFTDSSTTTTGKNIQGMKNMQQNFLAYFKRYQQQFLQHTKQNSCNSEQIQYSKYKQSEVTPKTESQILELHKTIQKPKHRVKYLVLLDIKTNHTVKQKIPQN